MFILYVCLTSILCLRVRFLTLIDDSLKALADEFGARTVFATAEHTSEELLREAQVAEVLDLIRRLKAQNVAVILISHRMPDVFAVCDHVAVMRRGRLVADKPIEDTSPEEVTGLITGAIERA